VLKKLILWDINGTLLDTSHAGARAFSRAFRQHFQITSDLSEIDFRSAVGGHSLDSLAAHNPDHFPPDLCDTKKLLSLLGPG
jgi:phosphoglycolate phosphatase-like HAD superfamily hydrolase